MCGPINDHIFYRGVRLDVAAVKEGGAMAAMAADIPFSALADTVLVPFLACHELMYPQPRISALMSEWRVKADKVDIDSFSQGSVK
jgi:hypothetical protein